jgi:hypothetical protein
MKSEGLAVLISGEKEIPVNCFEIALASDWKLIAVIVVVVILVFVYRKMK